MAIKKGPLTTGESNALVAMVTGCEPEQVKGWIVIAAINDYCPEHGMTQQIVTTTNLKRPAHIRMLAKSLDQTGEDMEDEAS